MDGDTSVTRNLEGINRRIIDVESEVGRGGRARPVQQERRCDCCDTVTSWHAWPTQAPASSCRRHMQARCTASPNPSHGCAGTMPRAPSPHSSVCAQLGWGKLEIHIRGTKNTQPAKFEGMKRCVHVAIQVRRGAGGGGEYKPSARSVAACPAAATALLEEAWLRGKRLVREGLV